MTRQPGLFLTEIICMAKFESSDLHIHTDCDTLYGFLSDFRNFEELLPEQVTNWKSDELTCSFTIPGFADLSMRINSKTPCRSIHIVSDGKNPADFTLDYLFIPSGDHCQLSIVFDVKLNPFLKTIASKPLQNFVNMLGEKLQERYP